MPRTSRRRLIKYRAWHCKHAEFSSSISIIQVFYEFVIYGNGKTRLNIELAFFRFQIRAFINQVIMLITINHESVNIYILIHSANLFTFLMVLIIRICERRMGDIAEKCF